MQEEFSKINKFPQQVTRYVSYVHKKGILTAQA